MGRRRNGGGGGWETAGGDKGATRKVKKRNTDEKDAAVREAKQRELMMKLPHWQQGVIGINAARSSSSSADGAGGWQSVGKGGEVQLNSKQRRQLARKAKQDAFAREQAQREQEERAQAQAEPLLKPWTDAGDAGTSGDGDAAANAPSAPTAPQRAGGGVLSTVTTVALTLLVVALALYFARQQGLVRLDV